jgi:hypothetical protein
MFLTTCGGQEQRKQPVRALPDPPRCRTRYHQGQFVNNATHKSGRSYRSFPSSVITMSVDPASPHGCHSILAIGAEAEEAWKYCPTWMDLQKTGLGIKRCEVHESDAYLQSIVDGTRRMKPDRGRTTTATWKVPATASSFPVGFIDN